ncbi:glycosyltransferase [Mycobacterium lacus]|uniref:glycosyltransferase n=1 Tax=Mycobacterium lacus TaxID=169765 RepID=UPI000A1583ED|nr:glycosyltransferase [Mycobacterium lacus]MCV7122519.1 glycosyltransferase [Mycobacterium lacus]
MIADKLSKPKLYSLFQAARRNGIFVFPSRYETLGITPLEAAMSGVCTLVTNSREVEASRLFPSEYRFVPEQDKLCSAIQRFHTEGIENSGAQLRDRISGEVSEKLFADDMLDAWTHFSRLSYGSVRDEGRED